MASASAGLRPYPFTKGSTASKLVRSVTKLVWNGENVDFSNVKMSSAFVGFATDHQELCSWKYQKWMETKWKLAQNVVSHVSVGQCPMSSAFAGLCPYPISKGSTSVLVRSGIKLVWNGEKCDVSNVKISSAYERFAPDPKELCPW